MGRSTTWTTDALTPSKSPAVARIWSMSCEPWAPSHPPPARASAHHDGTSDVGIDEHGDVHDPRGQTGLADQAVGAPTWASRA